MRLFAALLVGVLLVVSPASGVVAGHAGDDSARTPSSLPTSEMAASGVPTALPDDAVAISGPPSASNTSVNVTVRDSTEMRVSLRENGDGRWNVTARFVLHDENETAAFRELLANYESGKADVGFTRATFERVVEYANRDTDRPMSLQNVSRSGSVRQNGSIGVLSLTFTWTNFTRVEGNRVVLGDAFWVESKTWLPSLTGDQTLIIEGPSGYYVASSNVPHNGTRIRYDGPRTFEDGDFSVTFAPKETMTTSTTTPGGLPNLSATSGLVIVLFLFGLGGFGAYAVSQRRGPDPDPVEETDRVDGTSSPSSLMDETDGEDGADATTQDGDDDSQTELLSDEERVLRLLRKNDGRMKQADIVKQTNWSNAKVSQLLSKMNENEDVDKLRIGRENLITLPDEDVTDVD